VSSDDRRVSARRDATANSEYTVGFLRVLNVIGPPARGSWFAYCAAVGDL
jgi:hypothetical protein